jgi:multicomponent Na+:H+ antiporter subunit D
MFDLLPPTALLLTAAAAVAVLPRRVGHVLAALAALALLPWLFVVPAGEHAALSLLGFDSALFRVDALSRLVGLVFGLVTGANVLYALGSGTARRTTALALVYAAASLGAVFAGDWLALVVHWEAMALAATVLLWDGGGEARTAGTRYAVYHGIGGACLLAAVLLRYAATGTFAFEGGFGTGLAGLLAAVGVGVNVGFLGLHVWIPDAYPTPGVAVSAVLCGLTTKVGVYALARAAPEGSLVVAYLGAAMLVVGVTLAILQTDVRRLLSYHIVSQVGYMVAGVGLGSALGTAGAFAHLVNNVLYKTLLFMVAGVLVLRTGHEGLKAVHGVGRRMPLAAAAYLVAALAIVGTPGLAGYVSKAVVVDAAGKAGEPLLRWTLSLGGVGTVVSFAKFGYYAFYRTDGGTPAEARDATAPQAAGMALLAVPVVVFGLLPGTLVGLLPGEVTTSLLSPAKLAETVGILLGGAVLFLAARSTLARVPAVPDLDALYRPAGRTLWRAVPRGVAAGGAAVERGYAGVTVRAYRVATGAGDRRVPLDTALLWVVLSLAVGLTVLLL